MPPAQPAGGGAGSSGTPAPPPAAAAPTAEDFLKKSRAELVRELDAANIDDATRQEMLGGYDYFHGQSPTMQARILANAARLGRGQEGREEPQREREPERPPAKESEDETPLGKLAKKLDTVTDLVLGMANERKAEKEQRDADAQRKSLREKWDASVTAVISENPALKSALDDPEELAALQTEAMGFVSQNLPTFKGSERKALQAWSDRWTARAAKAAGMGVKEFIAQATKAAAAQTEAGSGRPPAETAREKKPTDLRDGTALQEAARLAGVDLNKDS